VIDEAHQFIESLNKTNSAMSFDTLMKRIDDTRTEDGDGVKIIALTATPVYNNDPLVLMRLLRLVGANLQLEKSMEKYKATHSRQYGIYSHLPTTKEELKHWLDPDTQTLSKNGAVMLTRAMDGLVSFVNNTRDPSYYAQFSQDDIIKVALSNVQIESYDKCTSVSLNLSDKGKTRGEIREAAIALHKKTVAQQVLDEAAATRMDDVVAAEPEPEYYEVPEEAMVLGARKFRRRFGSQTPLKLKKTKTATDAVCNDLENFADLHEFGLKTFPVYGTTEYENPNIQRRLINNIGEFSPKFEALYNRIVDLDEADAKSAKPDAIGKHCVWVNDASTGLRMFTLFCMTGEFRSVHGQYHSSKQQGLSFEAYPFNVAFIASNIKMLGIPKSSKDADNDAWRVYVKTIVDKFNSPENKNGKFIRFLIYDNSISEGFSFFNVRHLHMLEPTKTSGNILDFIQAPPDTARYHKFQAILKEELEQRKKDIVAYYKQIKQQAPAAADIDLVAQHELRADMDNIATQAIGRVRRYCGNRNLKFTEKGWEMTISRYEAMVEPEESAGRQDLNGMPISLFQATYSPAEHDISNIIVTMQLINVLQNASIERDFPPQGQRVVPTTKPHPQLGYYQPKKYQVGCEPQDSEVCEQLSKSN
jgi:hypothetical protein